MKMLRISFVFLAFVSISACANVQQIDRGRLAKRIMQLEPMPHQQAFISEMHTTREGSAGGIGQSTGGGCGCN